MSKLSNEERFELVKDQVLEIHDNGGKTLDRYTVVYDEVERHYVKYTLYNAFGMSTRPFHPQGFGQHCSAQRGSHLGRKIAFSDLPDECQRAVLQDLEEVD